MTVHNFPRIPLASEDHRDPQRDRTDVIGTRQPRLRTLDVNDVAKVRSAVSGHFLETTDRAVPQLGRSRGAGLVDFRGSAARRAKRIREGDVLAPREELEHWLRIAGHVCPESVSERLDSAVEVSRGRARFLSG